MADTRTEKREYTSANTSTVTDTNTDTSTVTDVNTNTPEHMRGLELELPSISVAAIHSNRYAIVKAAVLARVKDSGQNVTIAIFKLFDTFTSDFNYSSALFVGEDSSIAHLKSVDGSLLPPSSEGEESMRKILPALVDCDEKDTFVFPIQCVARALTKKWLLIGYSLIVFRTSEIIVCSLYRDGEKRSMVATLSYEGGSPVVNVPKGFDEDLKEGLLSVLHLDKGSLIHTKK